MLCGIHPLRVRHTQLSGCASQNVIESLLLVKTNPNTRQHSKKLVCRLGPLCRLSAACFDICHWDTCAHSKPNLRGLCVACMHIHPQSTLSECLQGAKLLLSVYVSRQERPFPESRRGQRKKLFIRWQLLSLPEASLGTTQVCIWVGGFIPEE